MLYIVISFLYLKVRIKLVKNEVSLNIEFVNETFH